MPSFVDLARRTAFVALLAGTGTPFALGAQSTLADGSRAEPGTRAPGALESRDARRGAGAPASIAIEGGARRMIIGATVPHVARVRDASGVERRDLPVRWTSSDPNVASVNQFGVMTAVRPGPVTIRAASAGLSAERRYIVEPNPVKSLTLSITADQVRTGDVVEVSAMAFDANGYKLPNVPFLYTFTATVEDGAVGQLAPAELDQRGRFVAQAAGDYQIIAVAPGLVAHRTVRVSNREPLAFARIVGRAPAPGSRLSDLAGWRARDGRDYLLACGGGTRAQVVSYEVSDAGLQALDTLALDGQTVSACVVDSTAGLAAVVREGSTGRSSVTVIDAANPRAMKALGSIEDGVGTLGGIAIEKGRVFAVSDARRLDVFTTDDPARPRRIGSLELSEGRNAAGTAPTDVSVLDGIAYVALGRQGVAVVDVGNGKFGGAPTKPVRVAGFRSPYASTQSAYGYRSRTGKWYVITSEASVTAREAEPAADAAPDAHLGFARIIDVSDPARPETIGRYEVPEAGVPSLRVDGERLYVAAQAGGARVVDISADLKGSLYHQGREVMRFTPATGGPGTPNVVAALPLHGLVLAGDRAAGIWLLRLTAQD